jgi:hypothetical protein
MVLTLYAVRPEETHSSFSSLPGQPMVNGNPDYPGKHTPACCRRLPKVNNNLRQSCAADLPRPPVS